MSHKLKEVLMSMLKIRGNADTAEYLGAITDDVIADCKTPEQIAQVEAISKELYTEFKMDTSETPLIDHVVETILLNMSEDEAVALLKVYNSAELATLMGCIQQTLDKFADGCERMEAVVHPEYFAEQQTTVLM